MPSNLTLPPLTSAAAVICVLVPDLVSEDDVTNAEESLCTTEYFTVATSSLISSRVTARYQALSYVLVWKVSMEVCRVLMAVLDPEVALVVSCAAAVVAPNCDQPPAVV